MDYFPKSKVFGILYYLYFESIFSWDVEVNGIDIYGSRISGLDSR